MWLSPAEPRLEHRLSTTRKERDTTSRRGQGVDLMQFRDAANVTRLNDLTNLNATPTSIK